MMHRTYRAMVKALIGVASAIVGCLCLMAPCLAQDDMRGGDILLSTMEGNDCWTDVAYNSHTQEFLVVWGSNGFVYGQGFNWRGLPQGEPFLISDESVAANLAVAYSLPADSYLVVWDDWRSFDDLDIYGRLVDAEWAPLGDTFEIYVGSGNQDHPDVAFDGSSYFVVWQGNYQNDSVDVLGRFVEDDGQVLPTIFPLGETGGFSYEDPAVAYNPTENEYLVAFSYGQDETAEIRGRRVYPSGLLPGGEYTITAQPDVREPDVAAAGWGAYVVVWMQSYDIHGRVVLAGADNSFDGNSFEISEATGHQLNPAIARSPSTGRFLVAWEDSRLYDSSGYDIFGQRLLADGRLADTNFAISTAIDGQGDAALAASQEPDIYLVAWSDLRSGSGSAYDFSDIRGQRVAWTGSLLWYDFGISARRGSQVLPDVAYNAETGEYMAVWEDQDEARIYAQRYSGDGQPMEEPQLIGDEGAKHQPTVGADVSFWIVAYQAEDSNALEYCILFSFGGVTTCHEVEDSPGGSTPRMAYAESTTLYLMVWAQGGDIYGGVRGPGGHIDELLVISSGGVGKADPDVTWDSEHQRFLVVWEETVAPNADIFGRFFTGEGEFASEKFMIAGGVGTSPRSDPVVTYNPDDDQYLVVYERSTGGDFDVCGQHVTWEGDPTGGEIDIWTGADGVDQGDPAVVYVPSMQRYYVVWEDDRNLPDSGSDLYGRLLEGDGSPATGALPFFRYPGNQQDPRVAYDSNQERVLVVWSDDRRPQGDVYARLGALDLTPPTAAFLHLPLVGDTDTTFLFSAGPSTDDLTPPGALEVRWDWTSDGSWDTEWSQEKLITHTEGLPGAYQVSLQVRDLVSHTDTISHPLLVLASGGKAPSADLTADKNSSVAGADVDLDASGSSDPTSSAAGYGVSNGLEVRWDWESDGVWDTGFSTTLSATHAFTVAGETTVRAEIQDAEGLTDAAFYNVTVLPGEPLALAVWPRAATMAPKAVSRFRATGWDMYGNRMYHPAVDWSVLDGDAGAINGSGLFTAGLQAGLYPNVIQVTSNGASDTAWVRILYPYRLYLPLAMRID